MAKTIPKLAIDPRVLHSARRKLQTKQPDEKLHLDSNEREALLRLIGKAKGRLYPTRNNISVYQWNLDQVEEINPWEEPMKFDRIAEQVQEFETKFCK